MAKPFHLTIAKIGENLFEGEALSVMLPGKDGVFEVLANHEPFVSELRVGKAHIVTEDNQKQVVDIEANGIAEVSDGQATILL